jgi:hypothetical protein
VSEVKRGFLMRLVVPVEWHIHVRRDGDEYVLEYEERFEKPENMSSEDFASVVESSAEFTKIVLRSANLDVDVRRVESDGSVSLSFRVRAPLDVIASQIAGEFLPFSSFGDMTVRDLLSLACVGFGALSVLSRETSRDEQGRLVEVIGGVRRVQGPSR